MLLALVLALFIATPSFASEPTLDMACHHTGNPSGPTILLVHGLAHNQDHWPQEFIEALGTDVCTLSLRGHGHSSLGNAPLWRTGERAYVQDIDRAINQIGKSVILVGHSMSAYLAQRYAMRHGEKLAGLVIMSPPGPNGAWLPTGRLIINHPLVLLKMIATMDSGFYLKPHSVCHDHLFHPGITLEDTTDHCASMTSESFLIFPQMLIQSPKIRRIKRHNIPVMVMSGELDNIFFPREVGRVAKRYNVPHHLFENMSHTLMSEPGWEDVAETLNAFILENTR